MLSRRTDAEGGGRRRDRGRSGGGQNHYDTVGEPPRTEIYVSYIPSLKAKKLGKLAPEKVLPEL